ncbi:MAG: dienelactone hydrolase-like enzyme [Mycobacterium sp.]|nr:dienelactone hydrolase-like enzyme [Mycobacterium sp.]
MTSLTTLSFDYELDGLDCNAVMLSGDDAQAPTLLVFHGMEGRSDAQVEFCGRLAEIGYRAVAVDIFGREVSRHVARDGMDAGAEAMNAMLRDRDALRDRLFGVVEIPAHCPPSSGPRWPRSDSAHRGRRERRSRACVGASVERSSPSVLSWPPLCGYASLQ